MAASSRVHPSVWVPGPLFTIAALLCSTGVARYLVPIPNVPLLLLVTVIFAAFSGGFVPGAISAALTWIAVLYFFSIPTHPLQYTSENFWRVIVWSIVLPAVVLMVGTLKKRTLQQIVRLEESEARLQTMMNSMADAVLTVDEHGGVMSFNRAAEQLFGYAASEAIGRHITTFLVEPDALGGVFPAPSAERPRISLSALPSVPREALCRSKDGVEIPVEIGVTPMTFSGSKLLLCSARDIRERKRAEAAQRQAEEERRLSERARHAAQEELLRVQEEMLRVQKSALAELLTPLLPVRSRILVMPLIGGVDAERAERIIEVLLQGIADRRAHSAILDVTGLPVIDTHVADALVRAANAAAMLGAHVVLTGIRPEVAQTLVALGAELRNVVTCRTLEQGIAFAERQG